jgi:hypothetical protein
MRGSDFSLKNQITNKKKISFFPSESFIIFFFLCCLDCI